MHKVYVDRENFVFKYVRTYITINSYMKLHIMHISNYITQAFAVGSFKKCSYHNGDGHANILTYACVVNSLYVYHYEIIDI